MVDKTIKCCSNILDSPVSKTIDCGSNLSIPQISKEYNQRKSVLKKLDEQLADVSKNFIKSAVVLNQITNFCIITTKHRQKGTTLIAGNYLLHEIGESRLPGAKQNSDKVRTFQGATTDHMKDFLKPHLKCSPTNIILHVDTNNSINDSTSFILNKLLSLKNFIHTKLPECNIILSHIIDRSDDGIAKLKISNFNKHLNSLKMDIIDNGHI